MKSLGYLGAVKKTQRDDAIKSLPEGRGHESKSQFLMTFRLLSQSPDSAIRSKHAVKRLLSVAYENMHSTKRT